MLSAKKMSVIICLCLAFMFVPHSIAGWFGKKKNSFKISGSVWKAENLSAIGFPIELFDGKSGKIIGVCKTSIWGTYKFKNLNPGHYIVKAGNFRRNVIISKKNVKENFNLSSPDGQMHLLMYIAKGVAAQVADGPDPGPTDSRLANLIAGEYYSYQGSTERRLMLCPNGIFFDSKESSYGGNFTSGGARTGSWGAANASSGSGRWSIKGNLQRGSITFCYKNSQECQTVQYYNVGDNCLKINGITFCYKNRPTCK